MKKPNARYHAVTRSEMEAFLCARPMNFILLNPPNKQSSCSPDLKNTVELVYGFRLQPVEKQMSMRVYSGIWPDGTSREVGTDAIRVVTVWRDLRPYESGTTDEPPVYIVSEAITVKRTQTWQENLRKRIMQVYGSIMGPTCPECGAPTVLRTRKSDRKQFWGCARFSSNGTDKCCFTQPME